MNAFDRLFIKEHQQPDDITAIERVILDAAKSGHGTTALLAARQFEDLQRSFPIKMKDRQIRERVSYLFIGFTAQNPALITNALLEPLIDLIRRAYLEGLLSIKGAVEVMGADDIEKYQR